MPPKAHKTRTDIVVEVPPPSKGPPSSSSRPPPLPSTPRATLPRQPSAAAPPASPRTRTNPAPADDLADDTDSSSDTRIHDRLVGPTSPAARRTRTQRAETEVVPETDHEGAAPALSGTAAVEAREFGSPRSKRGPRGYASKGRGARREGVAGARSQREEAAQGQEQAVGAQEQDGEADEQGSEDESPPLATRVPASAKRAAAVAAQEQLSREMRSAGASVEEKAERDSEAGEGEGEGEQHGAEDEVDQLADTDTDTDDGNIDSDSSPRATSKRKGKAPARAPASSYSNKRKAPSQRSARASPKKKKRVAPPERDSGSEEELPERDGEDEGEGGLSPDEASDEDDERPPEFVLSHRGGDGSWVPDQIWLHREWQKDGKREQVARWIKEHGGKVMKRMEHAHYAILPDWTSDNYVDLYAQAFNSNAMPTLYAWLLAARDDTAQHGVPCRPNPLDFAAPRPLRRPSGADHRSERYLRLSDAELDEFARLYILCDEGDMSPAEMFSRMQREFYSELESRGTTTSAYRDKFDLHHRTIKQRARRLREDAKRAHATGAPQSRSRSPSAFRSPSPPRARSPAPPRKDKRRRSPPAHAPDPLAALAQRYGRSTAFVDALLRACTLDARAAEGALRRLAAWERAAGVDGEDEGEDEDEEEEERAWDEVLRGVWRAEDDEELRGMGDEESDAELSRRSGGRWSAREIGERRELLRARGDERWGWEVTREELRSESEAEAAGRRDLWE